MNEFINMIQTRGCFYKIIIFSLFWHSLVWGSKFFNWIHREANFLAKDLSFKLHCAPSLLQSVTMFYPSIFPVSAFSPLWLYPNFDIPHLSPGQHHALSASLPVTTHFNPSFLLLSETFSKTQIDRVTLSSTPPPSSHWLLMQPPSARCPSPGWLNVFRLTFSPAYPTSSPCSRLSVPASSCPHTSLPLFLSFSLDCLAPLLQPIKVLPHLKAELKSHWSAAFPSHAGQDFSSLSPL